MYQNAKTREYLCIWRNRIILPKTYCECFSLCLGTKTPKCIQSTHTDCFICILDTKTCVMIFFFKLVTYQKAKTCQTLFMEKQSNVAKNVFWVFFFSSMLGTKITKHMQSILFEVTKRHSKRCVISVFLSILATKKAIKTLKTLYMGK